MCRPPQALFYRFFHRMGWNTSHRERNTHVVLGEAFNISRFFAEPNKVSPSMRKVRTFAAEGHQESLKIFWVDISCSTLRCWRAPHRQPLLRSRYNCEYRDPDRCDLCRRRCQADPQCVSPPCKVYGQTYQPSHQYMAHSGTAVVLWDSGIHLFIQLIPTSPNLAFKSMRSGFL